MPDPIRVDIYSRPGCHLCEVAKKVLEHVRRRYPFTLTEFNVETDPQLEEMYGAAIPVVLINGRPAFEYHVDEGELVKRIEQLWST